MNKLTALIVFAIVGSPLSVVWGQDDAGKQNVVKALKQLENANVVMNGSLKEEQPNEENSGVLGGGVQRMVVSTIGGSTSAPFTGDFELMVGKQALAIVSKEEFPGIKILHSAEKSICVQAHGDEPFGVNSLTSTVKQLVDWNALAQAVEESKKVRVAQTAGETTVRVVLDGSFIPVESMEKKIAQKMAGAGGAVANVAIQVGGASSLNPEVVDLVANVVLGQNNEIKSLEFVLQYSDPMKAMMANAMRIGGGGAVRIGGGAAQPKQSDEDPELGKLVTYTFTPAEKPSERMTQFVGYAKKLLDGKK